MLKLIFSMFFLALISMSGIAYACRDVRDYVVFTHDTSSSNYCYAVSLPKDSLKNKRGRTDVHIIEDGADVVVYSFNFYAREIFLKCGDFSGLDKRVALARRAGRFGSLSSGDYNLLEFYVDGKLAKKYTAKEITARGEVNWDGFCGDKIIWKTQIDGNNLVVQFALHKVNFDMMTGEIISTEDKPDEIYSKIMAGPGSQSGASKKKP